VSARKSSPWLCCYPRAWRERYGEELEGLLSETSGGGRVAWRVRGDLLRAGAGERLRSWGLAGDGVPAATQAKAGALLVLCAWTLFAVAGLSVQRLSEHWQDFTPASGRGLPSGAFQALVVVALLGSGLVLAGGACALPRLLVFLRGGGWSELRRPFARAVLLSALAAAATAGLVIWAHWLDASQRNGHDMLYGLAFAAAGLLVVVCLAAWTAAAVTAARQVELPARLLKLEVGLAVAVSLAMLTMTVSVAVWWAALASRAPWALHEQPSGAAQSPLVVQLLVSMMLMAVATVLGAAGAACALRALPRLPADGPASAETSP
jgi:hypothetical protein